MCGFSINKAFSEGATVCVDYLLDMVFELLIFWSEDPKMDIENFYKRDLKRAKKSPGIFKGKIMKLLQEAKR